MGDIFLEVKRRILQLDLGVMGHGGWSRGVEMSMMVEKEAQQPSDCAQVKNKMSEGFVGRF